MIIDFHTHIFPPDIISNRKKYLEIDPIFRSLYADVKSKLASVDNLIENMDLQNVDMSVIQNLQWTNPEVCHQTNDHIIECVKHFPGRLIGFGMVCLEDPAKAVQEIEYCAKNGLRGIGEIRPSPRLLGNIDMIRPIVNSLTERNMILCTHSSEPIGHIYPGKGDLSPEVLYPFIFACPELKLICAHWGGGLPFYSQMPEVNKALQNVYFDSAASPYLYNPQIYTQVAALSGPGHILFGSDYPLLKPQRLIQDIRKSNLSDHIQSQILGDNARALLGI
jgi:predicted TIM-barrel fold metal-dependent hydrolase